MKLTCHRIFFTFLGWAAVFPLWANTPADDGFGPSIEFLFSLGAVVFLVLFFGLLIWNRNQQQSAQRRTKELLAQLTESNAQTRDLQSQLSERKHAEEILLRRGNLKRIIASLSSDFVRLGPDEIDGGIERALAVIGEFAGVTRAYVFLVRDDHATVDNTHEWCSPGVAPFQDTLQGISLDEQVPWFGSRMRAFREVYIPSVADLPKEAKLEKELFRLQEIGSMFCVPMISSNKLRGFLGFDSAEAGTDWPDDIVQLLRIVGEIFTNALDRQRAEKTLRESEERFRELADLLPQTIFETDRHLKITYSNRFGLETSGYTHEELKAGINGFDLFQEDEQPRLREHVQTLMDEKDRSASGEYQCLRKDGSGFPAQIYARPILRDGKTMGFRGILIDITHQKKEEEERRKLESQFLQAQKFESLSVMAGSIAHNFNNLLTVVLGNLELVVNDTPRDAPWFESLKEADKAVRRAAELSTMMLTYVGKGQVRMTAQDLNPLVEDLEGMLRASLGKRVGLRLAPAAQACLFKGDSPQIRQVVLNLVTNAAEAIDHKSGEILITTGVTGFSHGDVADPINSEMDEGDYVYLDVRDNGCGMDQQTLARVFDPFFTTKFTGRGLGLAAVLGIVRAHQGGITIDSSPGKGTSVRIMLPNTVHEPKEKPDPTADAGVPFKGSGTVLLVDDEEMVLGVGERMLQRLGFQVITAADGLEALGLFDRHREKIRLVLLDLTMPRMDGEETFHELYKRMPEVRVVLASGYTEEQVADKFPHARPVAFIRKPFQLKDLEATLEHALGQKR